MNAVSVARSLGAAGVKVYALGQETSAVRRSRACDVFVDLGGDGDVQGRWLEWLARGPAGAVVLPCDDDGVELIARHRATLRDLGYLPFEADDDVMLAMLSKARTYQLARQIGVPAPNTASVATLQELEAVAARSTYPCALKPVFAHRFQRRSRTGVKAFVVRDAPELRERFAAALGMGVEMLVTEIIPGRDDQIFGYHAYIDERGGPLFEVTKRKLRQYPTGFGVGCYHVTGWDPEVADLGRAFLQRIGARGLANVEFKRDARDGALKLIECNHRFTATNEQIRLAGIDLALFTYNRLLGRPCPAVDTFRSGVTLWYPAQDTRALLDLRRAGDLSVAQWIGSVLRRQHLPLWRWDDPGPSVASAVDRVRRGVVKHGVQRRADSRRRRRPRRDDQRSARPGHGRAAPDLRRALRGAPRGAADHPTTVDTRRRPPESVDRASLRPSTAQETEGI